MKHAVVQQSTLGVALALVLMGTTAGPAVGDIGDLLADAVLGESGFTDSVALPIGPSTFSYPRGIAIDRSVAPNRVYVADSFYHRVLGWKNTDALANGAPADIVIGQPDFASFFCNQDPYTFYPYLPTTLSSLCGPQGLTVDGAGNLYVADTNNCRVLIFEDPFGTDQVADAVLGQAAGCAAGPIDGDHLGAPQGVAVDSAGNVYVADTNHCRILEYDQPLATDTVPDRVYGAPDFSHGGGCNGGSDAVFYPQTVSVDPAGHLYSGSIAGVYEYDTPLTKTTWDHKIGDGICNDNGPEAASTTCMAIAAVGDAAGHLFVADAGNSRILEFDSPFTINQAARVFGQPGFDGSVTLRQDACNTGGPSASSLCLQIDSLTSDGTGIKFEQGAGLDLDGNGNLWVADTLNHRVLRYDNPLGSDTAADLVLGHTTMNDIRQPLVASPQPGITMSYATLTLLRVDTTNSRVLIEGYDRPVGVIGQLDFATTGCNAGGLSAASLCNPASAGIDGSGNLWIADTGNNRVLEYQRPWYTADIINKQIIVKHGADRVFGQPDFVSNTCQAGSSGLCNPYALAWDGQQTLYISDSGNNRIVHHINPFADTIGDEVIGQPDFTTTSCNSGGVSATSLCDPRGMFGRIVLTALNPTGDVYVADHGNNRVLRYNMSASRAIAQEVFGQGDNMTTNTCAAGAGGLCGPSGVGVDGADNLLIADTDNNRVLEFQAPVSSDRTADVVFGQPDFNSTTCNNGGTSAHSLCQPTGVFVDTSYGGEVYIADAGNQRVLRFDAPYCAADFQLTPATRRQRGLFSHPTAAQLRVTAGAPGTHSDKLKLSGGMMLLENDGAPLCLVCGGLEPVVNILTSNGVAFHADIPLLGQKRLSASRSVYVGDVRGLIASGIEQFQISEGWFAPPRNQPQYFRYSYRGDAIGLDLSGFSETQATLRLQVGSICFDTALQCRSTNTGRNCSVATR